MTSLEQAEQFLKETYEKSEYLTAHPADKMYRLEHSYRVANISQEKIGAKGRAATGGADDRGTFA